MSLRLIIHIPRRTVKLLLYTLLAIAVLFIALTRTQVGREGLRQQFERQFNNTFVGELKIGKLNGNFVNTLFAYDIALLDSAGARVATVDAAILKPTWFELFTGTFSLNRVTLIRPKLDLVLQEDSTWNIAGLLQRHTERSKRSTWRFASSDIRISDGSIQTRNLGSLPDAVRSGTLFDYTNLSAAGIQAQLAVRWNNNLKLVDIDHFSFLIEEPQLALQNLKGQLVWENDRVELNEVQLISEATEINIAGWINHLNQFKTSPGELGLNLEVLDSHIDHDALRNIFPKLPLADTLDIATSITGSLDALKIEWLQAGKGALQLASKGEVFGLPDSARFNLSFENTTLARADLQRLLPETDLRHLPIDVNPLFSMFDVRGHVNLTNDLYKAPFYGKANFAIQSTAGFLNGDAEIQKTAPDSIIQYQATLRLDSLNLDQLIPTTALPTLLTGNVTLQGAGISIEEMVNSELQLDLGNSWIDEYPLDTLDVYVFASEGTVNLGSYIFQQGYGTLESDVQLRLNQALPTIEGGIKWSRLNLGQLLNRDSLTTDLAGQLLVSSRGLSLDELRGEMSIRLDSSAIVRGNTTYPLPSHNTVLSLTDAAPQVQTFKIEGDAGRLEIQGDLNVTTLASLSKLWAETLNTTLQHIVNKPPPGKRTIPDPDETPDIEQAITELYLDQLRTHAREAADSAAVSWPHVLDIELDIFRADILEALLPDSPTLNTNMHATARVETTPYTLSVEGQIDADSLRLPRLRFDQLDGRFSITADGLLPPEEQISFDGQFQADSMGILGQTLPSPYLTLGLSDQLGSLDLVTKSNQRTGSQRIETRFELLPDRNRWFVDDLFLSIGNSAWAIKEPTYLDLYGKTVIIQGLNLQSKSAEANLIQQVHLNGVLSPEPTDTARIQVDNIAIRPLSEFAQMKTVLGGLINGELALTTINNQPELTGIIDIDRFTLDDRVLGNVAITSRYIPRQPDVGLQIALTPVDSLDQEPLLPDAPRTAIYENNALMLDGTFRLPRFNEDATGFIDNGALNLGLTLTRADVFFFEYIFPNVLERTDGYLTGNGTIKGDFSFPLFDANFELFDGEVSIPRFNLLYTDFSGPIRVNREGIMLSNATFSDPTGGTATLSGGFLFNDYRYFSFDLSAELNELLIMNQDYSDDLPFYGQIWSSGTATLTGPTHDALLLSNDAVTKASSELFIPVTEEELDSDAGFIIFADSTGQIPDLKQLAYRRNLLSQRPEGERRFVDGLSMDLNIFAPSGSTIHLVFDPLLGDVVNAVSSGRIQIQKREGEIRTFGSLNVESGDYLFTAGDVFARRFLIDRGGAIIWDGDPIDARLQIPASYRTRASTAGLPGAAFAEGAQIPLIVKLDITGRVSSPEVALGLQTDRSDRNYRGNYEGLETILNQAERTTDFATSVLLTNSFLLTTETTAGSDALSSSGNNLAFSSVSQLVASQLNRFLNKALPNVDLNLGLQGESLEDPDVTYGVALYLLDERLVIRGQGIYQNDLTQNQPGLEGEFEVEVRLSPNVSVSVFLRREGDVLAENALTSTRGAGLSYQTQFPSWRRLFNRLFGRSDKKKPTTPPTDQVAERPDE